MQPGSAGTKMKPSCLALEPMSHLPDLPSSTSGNQPPQWLQLPAPSSLCPSQAISLSEPPFPISPVLDRRHPRLPEPKESCHLQKRKQALRGVGHTMFPKSKGSGERKRGGAFKRAKNIDEVSAATECQTLFKVLESQH